MLSFVKQWLPFTKKSFLVLENKLDYLPILGLLICLVTLPITSNHRNIFFSFIPILYFTANSFTVEKKVLVNFFSYELFFGLFLALAALSYFWAVNPTLIFYQLSVYLSLFAWLLMFRIFFQKEKNTRLFFLFTQLFLIALIFYFFIIYFFIDLSLSTDWNAILGYNWNYIAIHLLAITILVSVYYSDKLESNIKYVYALCIIPVIYIAFLVQSRTALIAFGVVVVYLGLTKLLKRKSKSFLFSFFILFIIFASIIASQLVTKFNFFDQDIARLLLIKNSIKIWLENPFAGIGIGNWHLEANKYFYSDHNPHFFQRLGSHNYIGELLAELGLMGFLCLSVPILLLVVNNFLKNDSGTTAFVAVLLIYLTAILFYRDANSYEGHFSGIQLLVFVGLGYLGKKGKRIVSIHSILFAIVSLIPLLYFTLYHFDKVKIIKAQELKSEYPTKAIAIYESIYRVGFSNAHGFKNNQSINLIIPQELAEIYADIDSLDKAKKLFGESIKIAPYNESLLFAYADFLYRKLNDYEGAKEQLNKIIKIQDNHFDTNLLMAEILLVQEDNEQAKRFLDKVNSFYEEFLLKRNSLELRLFCSEDYLNQIVGDNRIQKKLQSERVISKIDAINNSKSHNENKDWIYSALKRVDSIFVEELSYEAFGKYQKSKVSYKAVVEYDLGNLNKLLYLNANQSKTIEMLLYTYGRLGHNFYYYHAKYKSHTSSQKEKILFREKLSTYACSLETKIREVLTERQLRLYEQHEHKAPIKYWGCK